MRSTQFPYQLFEIYAKYTIAMMSTDQYLMRSQILEPNLLYHIEASGLSIVDNLLPESVYHQSVWLKYDSDMSKLCYSFSTKKQQANNADQSTQLQNYFTFISVSTLDHTPLIHVISKNGNVEKQFFSFMETTDAF